ncbi:MAG: hypothetical protein WA162_09230 [Thermodesulfobacteriota bacterium]|mgnify:CR=1 FL=1
MDIQEDLAVTYSNYMEDVKSRLAVVRTVSGAQLSTGNELFDYEFVSIQLRKSLELVAFASMAANKKLYAEAHANFAKHWRAKEMLSNLERLHPGFYPQPIRLDHVKESGAKHFEHIENGYLTKGDFETLYDLCSEVLHTRNPFTQKNRHIDFKHSVAEWVQRIESLLRLHLMRFVDREEIWMVDMEYFVDGKVHAFRASPS